MTPQTTPSTSFSGSERLALVVLCAAVFVINVSTTIVNITRPRLTQDLGASTEDLLWIVEAFNLAFAALVLAGGSLAVAMRRSVAAVGRAWLARDPLTREGLAVRGNGEDG